MISKMALVVMDGNHNDWEQQKSFYNFKEEKDSKRFKK